MTSLASMTSNHSMASKIHNCDVLYIQNGFTAASNFFDLKNFCGLNSLRGHYDLNDLISSEYCKN